MKRGDWINGALVIIVLAAMLWYVTPDIWRCAQPEAKCERANIPSVFRGIGP